MNELNPKFEFNALFPFIAGESVTLRVKDWNRLGKKNKAIGSLVLAQAKHLKPGGSLKDKWYSLQGVASGQVRLSVFRTNPQDKQEGHGGEGSEGATAEEWAEGEQTLADQLKQQANMAKMERKRRKTRGSIFSSFKTKLSPRKLREEEGESQGQ